MNTLGKCSSIFKKILVTSCLVLNTNLVSKERNCSHVENILAFRNSSQLTRETQRYFLTVASFESVFIIHTVVATGKHKYAVNQEKWHFLLLQWKLHTWPSLNDSQFLILAIFEFYKVMLCYIVNRAAVACLPKIQFYTFPRMAVEETLHFIPIF